MIDITAEHDAKEMLLLHQEDLERRVDRAHERAAGDERADVARDRRAPTDGGRAPAGRGAVPTARREHAGHRLHLGGPSGRRGPILRLRESACPGRARVLTRGMACVHAYPPARSGGAWPRPSIGAPRTGEPFLMEYRFLAKDGSVVWVLDHASLIARAEVGDPASFQGVMLDITARKEAESKAEAAEDRFRTLTERGPVVAYSFELAYDDGEDDPPLSRVLREPPGRRARPIPGRALARRCRRMVRDGASGRSRARGADHGPELADRGARGRAATG